MTALCGQNLLNNTQLYVLTTRKLDFILQIVTYSFLFCFVLFALLFLFGHFGTFSNLLISMG